ncbi:hypothetical protein OQA88_45 [Cercophora sp. LCS_1]
MMSLHNLQKRYLGSFEDALVPLGLSFFGDDGTLSRSNMSPRDLDVVRQFLGYQFKVREIRLYETWIVLGCDPSILNNKKYKMPPYVGGMIAIWRHDGETDDFRPAIGDLGLVGCCGELDETLRLGLPYNAAPARQALEQLATLLFPDCIAFTFLRNNTLIVELAQVDDKTHQERLKTLPSTFLWLNYILRYYNGPLPRSERQGFVNELAPMIRPSPDLPLCPGTKITTMSGKNESTVGVLVERGTEKRVTCAFAPWANISAEHSCFGEFGETTARSRGMSGAQLSGRAKMMGKVAERVPETDIGLIRLHKAAKFANTLMGVGVAVKSLVGGRDVAIYDKLMMESYDGGKIPLLSLGFRAKVKRVARQDGSSVAYISAIQGVSARSDTAPRRKWFDGSTPDSRTCGSVLVRHQKRQGNSWVNVLSEGEVCGLLNDAGVHPRDGCVNAEDLLVFFDTMDTLIEDGWRVVT